MRILAVNPAAPRFDKLAEAIDVLAGGGVVALATETVASGRFPLARKLNLVTGDDPSALAAEFIGFARSPEVRGLFQEYAFVPVD